MCIRDRLTSNWTYLRKYLNPLQPNVFSPSLPFWAKYKNPLPPLNFSPHLLHIISHWAMITMRKYVSADETMQILHSYQGVLSRNNLEELQKLKSPSVSTFDTQLTDSKFRNFPPLLFHPPRQNHLAKKPSWAVRHNLNKNWAKPAKTWRSFVDVSANSRTTWREAAEALISLWNIFEREYSAE